MIDHVVVDVEIQKTIEETPGGWDATDKLGVAVACVWEYRTQRMRVYGPEDVQALRDRLLMADRVSGFNIWRFDFQVIWGFPREFWMSPEDSQDPFLVDAISSIRRQLRPKTNDILERIWLALGLKDDEFSDLHRGWGLDAVASSTLGVGKIGNGADAPRWYQAGQVQRVVNYCADDVAIERDLTDFVDDFGFVLNDKVVRKVLRIAPWKAVKS